MVGTAQVRLCPPREDWRAILPGGQVVYDIQKLCQDPKIKIFRFIRSANRGISPAIPSHSEGVGRRHDEGRVAVDVEVPRRTAPCPAKPFGEDGRCVRQKRVVLTPQMLASSLAESFAKRRWQQSMGSPGRARYKP